MNVVVIGAGIAGLTASIKLAENGVKVNLISPAHSEQSQSVMAMGGINASLNTKGENDSSENHYNDTINGGCGINSPNAVLKLTKNAPKVVRWLDSIGTSFTRDDDGNIDLRYFGGQKKMRTAYAGARTGKQIVSALTSKCLKYEFEGNIKRFVGFRFLSLIKNDSECFGAICINENTSEVKKFYSDAVIMATGGMNKLFGKTSGSTQNDGLASARLFVQGVEFANLEMIQYHPTTVETPSKRMLITEAARGEGGILYVLKNGRKWRFMKEWYPEMAELMPRDVVSRSIYNASENGSNQVYLDITHLDDDLIKTKLDEVYETCMAFLNLNPCNEPIPVFPGIHYFMGGIRTDENHKTNINRLFAAGECSCQYHGANRLGGNSLLGAVHGGYVAASNALKLDETDGFNCGCDFDAELIENDAEIADIMNKSMAIYRNEENLKDALSKLNKLNENSLSILAKAMILSALSRKESRGAHQRSDYSESSDEYKKITSVIYDGEIKVSFKEVV